MSILDISQLQEMLPTSEKSQNISELLQKDSFIAEVQQIMYQFPYILVTWSLKDPTTEDDQEFQRYMKEIKLKFSKDCIAIINQIG